MRPLSIDRVIVPRSEISQPTLPSARNWSRYQGTVSLSAAAQVLPPSRCGPSCRRRRSPGRSRLSKNQTLLRVAWATPPALRALPAGAAVGAQPGLAELVGEDEALRAEGAKAAQDLDAERQRHRLPGGAVVLGAQHGGVADRDDRGRIGEAEGEAWPPLVGGCTTCHEAPPSAVRLSVRRVMKLVGSAGSTLPDSKPITSACMASTNSMSSE